MPFQTSESSTTSRLRLLISIMFTALRYYPILRQTLSVTKVIIGDKRHNATATNLICNKPYWATNVITDKSYNATDVISDKHNNLTKGTNVISDNVAYDVCR